MQLTIQETLQQAIKAHKVGRLEEAKKLYRAILDVAPGQSDANHNLVC